MPLAGIDTIRLNFNPESLLALKFILGFIMFGVALDLKIEDFRRVIKNPKGPSIGLVCQFFILPAATFSLIWLIDPLPSIALGMMLVAACPGGNVSNFYTHLSGGNTALSIGMTAISTTACVIMTPLNILFWGSLNEGTASILRAVNLDPVDMLVTVVILLGVPLALGMALATKAPNIAAKIRKPMKVLSILIFLAFVVIALKKNYAYFLDYVGMVMLAVITMNAMALALGYFAARLLKLDSRDARAISIEVGIQNSGLGLMLIFGFFDALGGMAIVAAWWGVWHLISGFAMASFWSYRDRRSQPEPQPA